MRKRLWMFLSLLFYGLTIARADDLFTREYHLKHADAAIIIRAINVAIANPTGKRIMGGQDKRLVVTDAIDQQNQIAELLPIIDQPSKETNPNKIYIEMVLRTSQALREQKIQSQHKPSAPAPRGAPVNSNELAKSYDVHLSTQPYKSVYSDEDAKLMRKPRVIEDDPPLPSLSALTLKGIFKSTSGTPIALLSYAEEIFIARDGGLFDIRRNRLKGVVSQVKRDSVILTGPDRIPKEIKFKSSL